MVNKFRTEYYFDDILRAYKTKAKKKQIVLMNTGSEIEYFLNKIKNRYNSKYNKIPAFSISGSGEIYQHYDTTYVSGSLENLNFDRQAITIALENVGWLTKDDINNKYYDWLGDIYKKPVIEQSWRNKKYWASYTDIQLNVLSDLIDYLCIEYNIRKHFIGHNVLVDNPLNFNGILNRSNISKQHYDLTPAFDFEKLTEKLKLTDNVERE